MLTANLVIDGCGNLGIDFIERERHAVSFHNMYRASGFWLLQSF
jgi:hypothetical protein